MKKLQKPQLQDYEIQQLKETFDLFDTEGIGRVPVLGALPLIGWLFSSESTLTSRLRFYVFIRASILRSAEFQHLRFLSDIDVQRAELDPRWPEVEPALIR
jgi:type II secretory pathway component GspD/PulD (secretin)